MNKKYLAGLMGGLTMMGAMGLNTSAQVENQSKVKTKSKTSFLNKVDKTVVGITGASFLVGGVLVETLNLFFRKPKIEYRDREIETKKTVETKVINPAFTLTEEEQKIYDKTVELSRELLKYVAKSIQDTGKMPSEPLDDKNPQHREILNLIKKIRTAWINMYEKSENVKLDDEQKQKVINNKEGTIDSLTIFPVKVQSDALVCLFKWLPIDTTKMCNHCLPADLYDCTERIPISIALCTLEKEYRITFDAMQRQCESKDNITL